MSCWNFLQIEPTKDLGEIKKAYSKLLKVYHPEKDHDGFMKLRQAYEDAVTEAKKEEQVANVVKTPVDLWMDKVEDCYNNFRKRLDVNAWSEILDDDVVVAIDSSKECLERLLVYFMEHFYIPHEVLVVLDEFFHFTNKREELSQKFQVGYLDYLISNVKYPDSFRYMLFEVQDGLNYEGFLESYFELEQLLQRGESSKEEIKSKIEHIISFKITHPDYLALMIHAYLFVEEREEALNCGKELMALRPDDNKTIYETARMYYELQEYETAISYFEQLLEKDDKNVGGLVGIGACYKEHGDVKKAVSYAKKAQEILPYDGYIRSFVASVTDDYTKLLEEQYKTEKEQGQIANETVFDLCKAYVDSFQNEKALDHVDELKEENYDGIKYHELMYNIYMDMERIHTTEAVKHLKKCMEMNPNNIKYYEDIGYCYIESGEFDEAKKAFAKGKEIDSQSPRIYYRLAQVYIKEKDYEKAVEVCDEGLEIRDNIPNLYHFKGEAFYYMRLYGPAMECLDRALAILPYIDTYEYKLRILNEVQEYEETLKQVERLEQMKFVSDAIMVEKAVALRKTDKVAQAGEILRKLKEDKSKENRAYHQLALIDLSEGKMENALENIERAIELDRMNNEEYVYLKAQIYREQDKLGDAVGVYRKFEKKCGLSDFLRIELGDIYMGMKKYVVALDCFKQALEQNPRNPHVHGHLCDAYMELEKYKEALEEVNIQLEVNPSDYYYINRGIIYHYLGQDEKCKAEYLKAGEVNPDNAYAWSNLGYMERNEGNHDQALAYFKLAVEKEHPSPQVKLQLAIQYRRHKQYKEAVKIATELTKEYKSYFEAYSVVVKSYLDQGLFDVALVTINEMKIQFPNDLNLVEEFHARLLKDQGNSKEAIRIYKKLIQMNPESKADYERYIADIYYCDLLKWRKALKYFQASYDHGEAIPYTIGKLGELYEKKKDFAKSKEYLRRVLAMDLKTYKEDPESPCNCDRVGYDYAMLGQYDKAIEFLNKAIEFGCKAQNCSLCQCYEVYYDLGETYLRMGDKEKALMYFEKALEHKPYKKKYQVKVALLKGEKY